MNSLGFSQYLAGNQESEPILPICPLFKITHGFYVRLGDVSRPVFPSEWGSAFSRYWMSFRLLWTYPPVLFWTPRWPVDIMRPSYSRRAKTYRSEKPKCFIVDADRKLWGKSERQKSSVISHVRHYICQFWHVLVGLKERFWSERSINRYVQPHSQVCVRQEWFAWYGWTVSPEYRGKEPEKQKWMRGCVQWSVNGLIRRASSEILNNELHVRPPRKWRDFLQNHLAQIIWSWQWQTHEFFIGKGG